MTTAAPILRTLLPLGVVAAGALSAAADPFGQEGQLPKPSENAEKVLHVTRNGDGELAGETGQPIRAALDQLRKTGGTVVLEPGEYLVRRKLVLSDNITIRGSGSAAASILRLPAPTRLTASAGKGDRTFTVANSAVFASGTAVQILPPAGADRFSPLEGKTKSATIEAAEITSVDGSRITLAEPLPIDLPKDSRVGYFHNLISMRKPARNITIENLTLEGGRTSEVPMPGHAKRCAIWASSPYTYAEGPQAPPIRGLRVRHCVIRDFYGRAVAMYNVADSEVVGCRIARIPDDAINFDHFNYRNRAVGNTVREARIGVTLNDASNCTVRYNRLVRCSTGVRIWWWDQVDPHNVNEHNMIEYNTILAPRGDAISLGKRVTKNTIRQNFVEGPIRTDEKDNTVSDNTQLTSAAKTDD